jgi:hypothetical protein
MSVTNARMSGPTRIMSVIIRLLCLLIGKLSLTKKIMSVTMAMLTHPDRVAEGPPSVFG